MNATTLLAFLNLSLTNVLLHLMNFLLLAIALYFLLFKPVSKKIKARREKEEKIKADSEKLAQNMAKAKEDYDKIIENAKAEADSLKESAIEKAKTEKAAIIEDAKKTAKKIMENTRIDARQERKKLEGEIREEIKGKSVEVAGKIIEREITAADNEKLIEESLKKWSEDE